MYFIIWVSFSRFLFCSISSTIHGRKTELLKKRQIDAITRREKEKRLKEVEATVLANQAAANPIGNDRDSESDGDSENPLMIDETAS